MTIDQLRDALGWLALGHAVLALSLVALAVLLNLLDGKPAINLRGLRDDRTD